MFSGSTPFDFQSTPALPNGMVRFAACVCHLDFRGQGGSCFIAAKACDDSDRTGAMLGSETDLQEAQLVLESLERTFGRLIAELFNSSATADPNATQPRNRHVVCIESFSNPIRPLLELGLSFAASGLDGRAKTWAHSTRTLARSAKLPLRCCQIRGIY